LRRGINPSTSTPVPFSLRRRGEGDEVYKLNKCKITIKM